MVPTRKFGILRTIARIPVGVYGSENVPVRNCICIFLLRDFSRRSGRTKLQILLVNRAARAGSNNLSSYNTKQRVLFDPLQLLIVPFTRFSVVVVFSSIGSFVPPKNFRFIFLEGRSVTNYVCTQFKPGMRGEGILFQPFHAPNSSRSNWEL